MVPENQGEPERTRADRFLEAFRTLEHQVRRLARADRDEPFVAALMSACGRSPELRRYQAELRHFAMLRNAIVHEPYEGREPIADPREDAVAEIEGLARAILDPPTALSVLPHPVIVANLDTSLKDASIVMRDGNFSQLPVVNKGRVVDVLTSSAVARYLTSVVFEAADGDQAIAVKTVVPYDKDRRFVTKPLDASVLTVVEEFERREASGRLLNAVCLTGEDRNGLAGIATLYDLPALLKASRPYQ
jgi:CBS domain